DQSSPDASEQQNSWQRSGDAAPANAYLKVKHDMYSEIHLELGSVSARVSPARGAIATSLSIGGTELLYLDRETFHDPANNVRGGIPILFPFAGSLENGRLEASGTLIPQHGFARNQQWTVLSQSAATLRLGLESSPSAD